MSTITTRTAKGSELTWAELDANFTALNADKLQPDVNGNVGIGTSSPSTRLDIQGTTAIQPHLRLKAATGSTGGFNRAILALMNNAASETGWRIVENGDANDILTIESVVSGTSTTRATLATNGVLSVGQRIQTTGNTVPASGAGIELGSDGSTTTYITSYNRTGSAYLAGISDASSHTWQNSGNLAMQLNSTGNLALSTTTPNWPTGGNISLPDTGGVIANGTSLNTGTNYYFNSGFKYVGTGAATHYYQNAGSHVWDTAASGTAGNAITFTQAMTLDASGNLLVGTTNANAKITVYGVQANRTLLVRTNSSTATDVPLTAWNDATAGNNVFVDFGTEATYTVRGYIDYNRAGGLVRYNTTSDYRAKDIIGPVQNPGATIDALKVYEGVMKGATQSRPMLIAHEAQAHAPYAVSGTKDDVNEDGTPKYQQIDVSSLVPLLLAEIQSLRKRLAALEAQ